MVGSTHQHVINRYNYRAGSQIPGDKKLKGKKIWRTGTLTKKKITCPHFIMACEKLKGEGRRLKPIMACSNRYTQMAPWRALLSPSIAGNNYFGEKAQRKRFQILTWLFHLSFSFSLKLLVGGDKKKTKKRQNHEKKHIAKRKQCSVWENNASIG